MVWYQPRTMIRIGFGSILGVNVAHGVHWWDAGLSLDEHPHVHTSTSSINPLHAHTTTSHTHTSRTHTHSKSRPRLLEDTKIYRSNQTWSILGRPGRFSSLLEHELASHGSSLCRLTLKFHQKGRHILASPTVWCSQCFLQSVSSAKTYLRHPEDRSPSLRRRCQGWSPWPWSQGGVSSIQWAASPKRPSSCWPCAEWLQSRIDMSTSGNSNF